MAASLARGRASTYCFSLQLWKTSVRHASKGSNAYYVLLPEIPPDTAETNAVMRTDQLPQFSEISPAKCVNACAKLAIEYETKLENHIEALKDAKKDKTFESVYHPLEEIAVPLNTAWATVKNLNYVSDDYRRAFSRVHPQVERAKNERWVSETLFYAFKELESNSANLTEFQRRLVDVYLLEGRLNGIELSAADRSQLVEALKLIGKESHNFRNKVRICTEMFTHDISDFGSLEEMPWPLLAQMSRDSENPTRGPWRATLQPASYQSMMTYCSDRMTRWNLWQAYQNRASHVHAGQFLNNNKLIDNLRTYRSDVAKMLGYENFVEMSMETKMAGSVENVLSMIETLKGRFAPVLWEEVEQLQKFAESEGFRNRLEMWDMSYWQRRQREHLYGADKEKVSEYFPLNTVLLGLFDLCTKLFGVSFEEVTPEVDLWHSDARFFNITDANGDHLSSFYFDPFARREKTPSPYMDMGRENSEVMGTWPYSYLSLKIPRPQSPSDPSLMRFEDVQMLFQEFGHGLQQMLTKVPYSEISGQKNIEWDAVQVCSKFLKQWLTVPSVVRSLSGHHETGQAIPDDLLENTIKASSHSYNFDMMYQLYVSAFDMEIYMTNTQWRTIMAQLWDSFLPLPLDDKDCLPCSMTPIFCELYPAAYYSHKWSEMIAADLFSAFKEVGLENDDEVKKLGKRFRDTYLSLGGGVPASEVFRRFRGRDPSTDALQPPILS
ncbi:probable cytosolic oligopeptidase A [Aplysia californica]|uniref:oligopeptidase A n=1 Tax=Aplysia californica TaxID=6500 RepID=A0ABM1A6W6_APLCA|nr:probable cytosolic oligopeptidase A [Aplysia californica]